jgi:hypothetical protein
MAARRYRIRVYDRGAEVMHDRTWAAVLDWDHPTVAKAELDELAYTLARADGARGDRVCRYYLAVHDWATGEFVCHWPTKPTERE